MENIRKATEKDLGRIAEIEIFNYRLNFYPIFKDDEYYFSDLQVKTYCTELENIHVYDDGVIKGFVATKGREIKKLFVEPVLQGQGIGARLLQFAVGLGADHLWALEKNRRAISFYLRHGFELTQEKKLEEYTTEYLVLLRRK